MEKPMTPARPPEPLTASPRAHDLVAQFLVPTDSPFKEYLRATDYCTAVMLYTESATDRKYFAHWRAAFTALMVSNATERMRLLKRLRSDFKQDRSPLTSLESAPRGR
jgi:hypothetical protein